MKLFISYSSKDIKNFDDSTIKDNLETQKIEYWIDRDGITNGDNILELIRTNLQECQACLFFATPNSIESTWCAMEIAAFWSAGKKLYIYNQNDLVSEDQFPEYLKGNDIYRGGTGKEIAAQIKAEFDKITTTGSEDLFKELKKLSKQLKPNNFFDASTLSRSPAMLKVATKYAQETGKNFNEMKYSPIHLSVAATDYPKYLVELQKNEYCRVKAIAIVDEIERFWDDEIGYSISRYAKHKKTQRVFVFKKPKDFSRLVGAIEDHCIRYEVRLVSEDKVHLNLNKKIYDFSLIWISDKNLSDTKEPPLGTILAYYKTVHGYNEIEFTSDPVKVQAHWARYQEVYNQASEPVKDRNNKLDMKLTQQRVFEPERKEMSYYIPEVEKYDQSERLHPYYKDMRDVMVGKLDALAKSKPDTLIKILEFGAGTGILSGDILKCLDENKIKGKLLSMEYDSEYFEHLFLAYDKNYRNFSALREDSRTYDPPGRFDFIYSSFADHHIIRTEEEANDYFYNVLINLHQYSTYIVGDEFLAEHDYSNKEQRKSAIKKYHTHIIDEAKKDLTNADEKTQPLIQGLIELETEAMNSGIRAVDNPSSPNAGDFKVSLAHYRERVERNGLRIESEQRIGPQAELLSKEVGGIYVIEIKLAET